MMINIEHSNRLADLADRVRLADIAMSTAAKEMGVRAIEAGKLLIEAKAECPHGSWLQFLAKAGLEERQAQRLMTIVRAGLESDTVSDLGMRGALALASKRRLPPSGSALVAYVGQPRFDHEWPLACRGQLTAWVFEAGNRRGFWHVVGMADYEKASEARWTQKPYPRSSEDLIFIAVDLVLDWRQSELSIEVVKTVQDGLGVPQILRDGFIDDAKGAA